MIYKAILDRGYVLVTDSDGRESSLGLKSSENFLGYCSEFFVVQDRNTIVTFDSRCNEIGHITLKASEVFSGVGGSLFHIQDGSYIDDYDKNCRRQ